MIFGGEKMPVRYCHTNGHLHERLCLFVSEGFDDYFGCKLKSI